MDSKDSLTTDTRNAGRPAPHCAGLRLRLFAALLLVLLLAAPVVRAEEFRTEVYMELDDAPAAVFPEAETFERKDLHLTNTQLQQARQLVAPAKPTIWEPFYISYTARKAGKVIGHAVICEEIGKHRPMTFIVASTPDGRVKDVAILMYREPVGSEVRHPRFLKQFAIKSLADPIRPHKDVRNISGATLSVIAMSRGVRKALAILKIARKERLLPSQ